MRHLSFQRAARMRGMSLIEIIVVLILVGGVLAVVGSRVLGGADRGKFNLAKTQVETIAQKIEQFEMDVGRLPNSLDELVSAPSGQRGWLGPYARSSDLLDPWNNPLEYRPGGEGGRRFTLVSYGADGRPGGDSVNQDIVHE